MKISEIFWKKDDYKPKQPSYEQPVGESFGDEAFSVIVNGQEWKFTSNEEVVDRDSSKIWHYVYSPQGQKHFMDWSPYDNPSKEDVELFIRLGVPTREQLGLRGPMRHEDLVKYARQKGAQLKR